MDYYSYYPYCSLVVPRHHKQLYWSRTVPHLRLYRKKLFEDLKGDSFIELKTTPLKQSEAEVYQKGIDVLLATDLVNLAHTNAYDVAIILSGDTDLIEAVKLVKNLGKTVIVISYHTPGNHKLSNISDLMNAGKFINLKDFTNKEIFAMSELREEKTRGDLIP